MSAVTVLLGVLFVLAQVSRPAPFTDHDASGRPLLDRSRPVPPKNEILSAWKKRQDAVRLFRFVWDEQQTHPEGWIPNPRHPEREWLAIPGLVCDRTYTVKKSVAVDGNRMRYTFELDREEEPDGIRVPAPPGVRADGLGLRRHYRDVSVFDGTTARTRLTSLLEGPHPPVALEKLIADVEIDYIEDPRWGWVPSGWRVTNAIRRNERLVSVAKVTGFRINASMTNEEFQ
jgi:hypothetical protein